MKKITILALHLGVGGIEKYISSLCKMLENDYEIKVISTYKKYDKPKFEFSDKIEIKYLINDSPKKDELKQAIKNKKVIISLKYLCKNILLLLKKYIENIKEIKKIDSDYVITTRDFHNKLVGRYCDEKIIKIATEHNHHNNNEKYINKVIKSIKNFNYFVLVSKELEEFYKDKIGSTKAVYIPNVIEDMPTFKSKIENNNIISIGRMSPEKGFINFIEIISEIKKDIETIKTTVNTEMLLGDDVPNLYIPFQEEGLACANMRVSIIEPKNIMGKSSALEVLGDSVKEVAIEMSKDISSLDWFDHTEYAIMETEYQIQKIEGLLQVIKMTVDSLKGE
ncbi:MAG: hypothetical protein RSH78_05085 [Bacilli bacterium]